MQGPLFPSHTHPQTQTQNQNPRPPGTALASHCIAAPCALVVLLGQLLGHAGSAFGQGCTHHSWEHPQGRGRLQHCCASTIQQQLLLLLLLLILPSQHSSPQQCPCLVPRKRCDGQDHERHLHAAERGASANMNFLSNAPALASGMA